MQRKAERNAEYTDAWDRLTRLHQVAHDIEAEGYDRRDEILCERASLLAQPEMEKSPGQDAGYRVLSFMVGGECHAVEATCVGKVLPVGPITQLPGLPSYIVGITAAEGNVISVVDLRSLLHIPLSRLSDPTAIIVLQGEANEFGILADEILGMEVFQKEDVQPPPANGNHHDSFLLGVTVNRTGLLNGIKLLNDSRLIIDAA